MTRQVTERDFRKEEFIDANPDDYEFRDDGKIVRKDRWERGVFRCVELLNMNSRSFEIDEVVDNIGKLIENHKQMKLEVMILQFMTRFQPIEINQTEAFTVENDFECECFRIINHPGIEDDGRALMTKELAKKFLDENIEKLNAIFGYE